ncbi:hypothetical protein QTO34_019051 [Cnephaeus nilssonii]|uniref:PRAME family member 9/15 n=1 Tax=Cnephaeus nilssonii TaxID=3371016 RepID=A0AA40HZX9_CNENI|nr:hypothetical protein QTO34_019051 [Eptesicus nilssonii]
MPYSLDVSTGFLWSTLRMSIRTPPTLLQLAGESLLRDQALAIAALEYLQAELFPPLFILAYRSRRHQSLKAMAQAWPFTVLPLGCLPQLSLDDALKAVFDGLDVLLAQKVRPRSSPNMEHPLAPVEVFLDLNFNERDRDEFLMYVIQWAQEREGLLHLCCKTLSIAEVPFRRVRKVLDAVQLDCIQEVEVNCTWDLLTLGMFAPYLGQMRNLQRLSLCHVHVLAGEDEDEEDDEEERGAGGRGAEGRGVGEGGTAILFPISLSDAQVAAPPRARYGLPLLPPRPSDQMLRQLKSLHLFGVSLADFQPEPLGALLEAVAPTLQDLGLDNCAMVDSQVEAILPVLSRCHQLREFTISENNFSVTTVGKLLCHTAGLPSLEVELYPVPLECYTTQGTVNQDRLALVRAELTGILRELGQPRSSVLAPSTLTPQGPAVTDEKRCIKAQAPEERFRVLQLCRQSSGSLPGLRSEPQPTWTQQVRRWKLRVLDLRKMGADFWRMWCGGRTQKLSPTGPVAVHRSSPNMEHPLAPVEVFLDLNFNERDRDEFLMYVIQWAQQRKGLLHLCCKTLRIAEGPFQRVRKVLDAVQLDCIQEVEVNCTWDLPTLGTFAPYLGQMRNLQRLSLSHIHVLSEEGEEEDDEEDEEELEEEVQEMEEEEESEKEEQEQEEEEQEWDEEEERQREEQEEPEEQGSFSQFLSQMLRLQHLRELDMESPSFLRGRLDQMLRCLQTPLDKLTITHFRRLTHSDLTHLFQCPNLRQLKSLRLYCASLADFSAEPLRALLEAVAPTLQDLGLDKCAMVDSQVEAILPVLSLCHQLSSFTISENHLSVATLEKLLRHTVGLRSLELELYPVPLECYTTQDTVNQDRLALVRAELSGILRELGQPRTILLSTKHSGHREFYDVAFSWPGSHAVPL